MYKSSRHFYFFVLVDESNKELQLDIHVSMKQQFYNIQYLPYKQKEPRQQKLS